MKSRFSSTLVYIQYQQGFFHSFYFFFAAFGVASFFSAGFASAFTFFAGAAVFFFAFCFFGLACGCFFDSFFMSQTIPSSFNAFTTSSLLAFALIAIARSNGSKCAMLHFRLRVSPSIMTYVLSRISTTTHFFRASLPAIFMQTLPTSNTAIFSTFLFVHVSSCLLVAERRKRRIA